MQRNHWSIILILIPFIGITQNSPWLFSAGIGGCKANKHTAFRYDGSDVEYDYDYSVEYYLSLAPNNQYSIYNRIKSSYDDRDFTFGEYPENLIYQPALSFNGTIGYFTDETHAFFLSFDFIDLKTIGQLTFEVEDPANQTAEPDIRVEGIEGKERRFVGFVGYEFNQLEKGENSAYFRLGANVTAALVEYNRMNVSGTYYTLTQRSNNGNIIYNNADYGGIGYGLSAGVGYRYFPQESLALDVGFRTDYTKVNIGPEFFQKFKPQFAIYLNIAKL